MQTDDIIPVIPLPLHRVWTLHSAETNHICHIRGRMNFGLGFGAETDNNHSFGMVSLSVQKEHKYTVDYGRNYKWFWCLWTETQHMAKSWFSRFVSYRRYTCSGWPHDWTTWLCLGFMPSYSVLRPSPYRRPALTALTLSTAYHNL